jgi:hypothetical protein
VDDEIHYSLEEWRPRHTVRRVPFDGLTFAYRAIDPLHSPTISWKKNNDCVLIVSVGDGFATAALLNKNTWYYYHLMQGSEVVSEVEVDMAGESSVIPASAILPFDLGLEILRGVADMPTLISDPLGKSSSMRV